MVNKTQILNTLAHTEKLYQKYTRDKRGLYFCKLAIIEVSGWIEESMDDIALSWAKRYLTNPHNLDFVKNTIISRTTSFEYDQHFRQMLMRVLGIIHLERLEKTLDQQKFTRMKSALLILKHSRDTQAHTHIKGATKTIDAPSVTKNHFQNVYDGLKDIEFCIRKVKI